MGSGPSMFSDLWSQLSSVQEARLLMVGLDAAGKTTILYRLKLDQIVTTLPTVGFNVETVEYKNLRLTVWDLGGQEKIRRKLWRQYYFGTQGVIFVVDSSDQERIEDAQEELQSMLKDDDLAEAPLLVYANKQDLPEAMDSNEVAQRLGLTELEIDGGMSSLAPQPPERGWKKESSGWRQCCRSGHGFASPLREHDDMWTRAADATIMLVSATIARCLALCCFSARRLWL
eukprot:CAMPEP_0178430636 /NCGR_PEP_ID=MMETSP0689_2-20121128/31425_1 /TAXON_ID=160604 /ORGANISM="Amphidinium massartii, Strain CS-259" /LENGTH=229 /DNA_ID=CAMNT_0020052505 /DNA_START=62 /DNA_END=749 /DNA_ORIENTATION=+